MNILELLAEDGFTFKKVSSSKGGIYKGPCVWCSGTDRFSVYPDDGRGGGYICNACSERGDRVKYLITFRNMKYTEACKYLNIIPNIKPKLTPVFNKTRNINHVPRSIPLPPDNWTKKATGLIFAYYENLLSAAGSPIRDYLLSEKWLTIETIKKARLGHNKTGKRFSKRIFGLPEDPEKNTVWISGGIIIPYFEDNKLIRLRIRQDNHDPRFSKYLIVPGSNTKFLIYPNYDPSKPTVIVESELDGWLLYQECSDIINVMASGSTVNYPCVDVDKKIKESSKTFVWGDGDKSGQKMNDWWIKNYLAIPIHTSVGLDVSDARSEGLNIREFILGQIKNSDISPIIDDISLINSNKDGIVIEIKKDILDEVFKNDEIEISDDSPFLDEYEPEANRKEQEYRTKFIDDAFEEKELEIKHEAKPVVEKPAQTKPSNSNCMGSGWCGRLKDGICLAVKKDVMDINACPDSIPKWYKWTDPECEAIQQIILLPQRKQRKRF